MDIPINVSNNFTKGKYAIVHTCSCEENKKIKFYGEEYQSHKVFEDSLLVNWNCKVTEQMDKWKTLHYTNNNRENLIPILSLVNVNCFIKPTGT